MIAFASMAAVVCAEAGMKVPSDPDNYSSEDYPHFDVYCRVQLGAPMPYPSAHFDNAKIIASLSEEEVKKVTYEDLLELGLNVDTSKP